MSSKLKARLALVPAAVMAGAGSVYAAVPTEVTTAISDGKTDALTVAGLVLAVIVAIAAIMWMRKGIR